MANLIRWDPFREIASMRNTMEHAFDDFLNRNQENFEEFDEININLFQTDDSIIVEASVPGVAPEDINISVTGNTLLIRGETKEDNEMKESNYQIREIKHGSFIRSIPLPSKVIADKATASFENGLLKLKMPKAEDKKPITIMISAK